jgi:hypothetical protein
MTAYFGYVICFTCFFHKVGSEVLMSVVATRFLKDTFTLDPFADSPYQLVMGSHFNSS